MIHKIIKEEIRVPGTLEDTYLETYLLSVTASQISLRCRRDRSYWSVRAAGTIILQTGKRR